MSYIYTVKPLKEAIKIAIEADQLTTDTDGTVKIYGINSENWPAGVELVRSERIKKENRSIVVGLFFIPQRYLDETEEEPEVPEFIQKLSTVLREDCTRIPCKKCPLYFLNGRVDCSNAIDFIKAEWGVKE